MTVPSALKFLLMLAFWRTAFLCFHFLFSFSIFPISFLSHLNSCIDNFKHSFVWIFFPGLFSVLESPFLPYFGDYSSCVFPTYSLFLIWFSSSFLHFLVWVISSLQSFLFTRPIVFLPCLLSFFHLARF